MEKKIEATTSEDEIFCFKILYQVSRSFSLIIDELDEPLRTTTCILYLILRCLDTIEDDTTIEEARKLEAFKTFPSYLDHLKWNCPIGVGHGLKLSWDNTSKYYIELMEKFDIVLRVFGRCTIENKKIIRDAVDEMAQGMIKYLNHSIETMADYNEYCYYVAGVLGITLTKLFKSNNVLANVHTNDIERLAISAGIFLQKTNIIRDVYEDLSQPKERIFYPREVWGKYVNNLRDLIHENHLPQAITCLNFLINDALQHLPDSITYISLLAPKATFRFCAIPQVLAVCTLEKMYNNPAVFSSNIKLEKTESAYIFESVTDMTSCLSIIKPYLSQLSRKVLSTDSCDGTQNWISECLKFVDK